MVHIVANVLFIRDDLMDCAARPRTLEIGENATGVEIRGDFPLGIPILQEGLVHPTNSCNLFIWTWHQNDPICLNAFVLPHPEQALLLSGVIDQHPAQSKAGSTTLLKTKLN